MKLQAIFFVTLSLIALSISIHAAENNQLAERKTAFAQAVQRATPQWIAGRLKPVALAAALCIPSVVGLIDIAAHIDHGEAHPLSFAALATAPILLPLATAIMTRQGFLVIRDLKVYKDFTSSKTHIHLNDFPTTQALNEMNNHHQILSGLAEYTRKHGNMFEKASLLTPGLRGYRNIKN